MKRSGTAAVRGDYDINDIKQKNNRFKKLH
jgi:hypothetical protein